MKLIIDIEPRYCKDMHSEVKTLYYEAINRITEAVSNGIPYDTSGDLISREALKQHIKEIFETEEKIDKKWAMGLKYSIKIIDKAPTIEERTHGEWIKWNFKTFGPMGDWEYKCSNCEKVYGGEYNFCPNCGADMGGEEE